MTQETEGATPDDTPPTPPTAPAADALGDAGLKALQAERDRANRRERENAALKQKLRDLEGKPATPDPDAVAAAVNAAVEQTRATYATAVARAQLTAAATGRLAHPDLAAQLIDVSTIAVDVDGSVQPDAIAGALDALVEKYPALAADTGRPGPLKPAGSADQGPRDAGDSLTSLIEQAITAGDSTGAIRLKLERAAQATP